MNATIQITMSLEPKNGILNLDDFIEDIENTLLRKYNGSDKFFRDQIQINTHTRVTKLVEDVSWNDA